MSFNDLPTQAPPRVNRQTKPTEFFSPQPSYTPPPEPQHQYNAQYLYPPQYQQPNHSQHFPPTTSAPSVVPEGWQPPPRINRTSKPVSFFAETTPVLAASAPSKIPSLTDAIASELQADVKSYIEHLRKFQQLVHKYSQLIPDEREALLLNGNAFDLEQHAEYVAAELDRLQPPLVPPELHARLSAAFKEAKTQAEGVSEFATRRARKRFTMTTDSGMVARFELQQAQIQMLEQQVEVAYDPRWASMEPLLEGGQLFEYTDEEIIREQNAQMMMLSQEVHELNQTYNEHAQEVYAQGQQLQVAETNIQQTQANVDEGVKTLVSTAKSKKYTGLTLGSAILGGVVGGAAGIVLGPAGIVLGAIGGFVAGGAAGHQTGKAIKHKQEQDIVRIQMDKKWVPDENAKNCYGCQKEFTTVRRRHHCRSCGEIFCQKCSKHKIKIADLAINKPVRVCKSCFDYQSSLPPPLPPGMDALAQSIDLYPSTYDPNNPNDPNATTTSSSSTSSSVEMYPPSSSSSSVEMYPPPSTWASP